MVEGVLLNILEKNEIALLGCEILEEKGIVSGYKIVRANNSFLKLVKIDKANPEGIVFKTQVNKESEKDWADFLAGAYSRADKNGYQAYLPGSDTKYDINSYRSGDFLYVTASEISSLASDIQNENEVQLNYELLFDNMLSGCIIYKKINDGATGDDFILVSANKAALRLDGRPYSEVVGKTFTKAARGLKNNDFLNNIKGVVETGREYLSDVRALEIAGRTFYYVYRIVKMSENYVAILYNDVTKAEVDRQEVENARNRLRHYIENSPYGIFISDRYGKVIEVNRQVLELTGYTKAEIIGNNLLAFIHKDDLMRAKEDLMRERDENEKFESTYRCITKYGTARVWNLSTVKLEENRFIGFLDDITIRKQLEERLTASEKEYRMLFDNSGFGIGYYDIDGNIKWVNRIAAEYLLSTPDALMGKNVLNVFADYAAEKQLKRIKKTAETRKAADYEDHLIVDGKEFYLMTTYNCIKDDEENVLGVEVIYINITELRQSQRELQKSRERFKLLFEDAPLGYQSISESGRIMSVNNAWLEMTGYQKSEAVGKDFTDFIKKEETQLFEEKFKELLERKSSYLYINMVKKDKSLIEVRIDGRVSLSENTDIKQIHCIVKDVTAEKLAENKLIASERRYSAMIANISDVIFLLDKERNIKYSSPNIHKWFGWDSESLIGVNALSLVHPDDKDYVIYETGMMERTPGATLSIEFRVLCKDGEAKNIHLVASNLLNDETINGILMNFHDITERVMLEKQKNEMDLYVRNQQKLESVGTLASGVAHEINNPINGIINYGQVIIDSVGDDMTIENCAQEIIHESLRVSEIVKNLLEFSRPHKQVFKPTEIKEIIDQTLSLIRTTLKHDMIDLRLDIAENLPQISCRSGQIQQIIMNLVTNARDSLNTKYPEADKDKVLIIKAEKIAKYEMNYVRLTIEDYGAGIPLSVRNRIFDPFFSTKSRDQGTGIGLSISHTIAKEHNGSLTFDTQTGKYTRFYLDLPAV